MSTPSADWSLRRSSMVRPVELRNASSGSMRWEKCRRSPRASASTASGGLIIIGRLPSVTEYWLPSSRTSRCGMRRQVLGLDVLGEVARGLVRVAVGRHHEVLVRVVWPRGPRPAGWSGCRLPPCVPRRFGDAHLQSFARHVRCGAPLVVDFPTWRSSTRPSGLTCPTAPSPTSTRRGSGGSRSTTPRTSATPSPASSRCRSRTSRPVSAPARSCSPRRGSTGSCPSGSSPASSSPSARGV